MKKNIQEVVTGKFRHYSLLAMLCLISLQAFSQGVPKAYESIYYQGKVNRHIVKFLLANGYIGVSALKIYLAAKTRPLVFEPDASVADERNQLKFVPVLAGSPGYFILNNMQEAYDETPACVTGNYFLNNKITPVKLRLLKVRRG